jgi:hypothetical protein
MLSRVVWYKLTDVTEMLNHQFLQDYMAQHTKTRPSLHSPPSEAEISTTQSNIFYSDHLVGTCAYQRTQCMKHTACWRLTSWPLATRSAKPSTASINCLHAAKFLNSVSHNCYRSYNSWKTRSCSWNPPFLRGPKLHCSIHESPPLVTILH